MQNRYAWDAEHDDDDDGDDDDDDDDFSMVYDEKNHGFNRRLVLPPCLAQHALHRLCPIVRSCIAPRGTPFPDLDPLWHKDCTLLYVSDENKNNTRVYDNIYIYIYIVYTLYTYI